MDKTCSNLRKKKHFLRNQQNGQNEPEVEEIRPGTQKIPLRDKCFQTDHHHHGCCEQEYQLEPGDPPLLQKPLQMSKSGILQIIDCFKSGTNQLKHILLKEVDTIFECRSCRSLFRGLPNLITHKQYYCLSRFSMDGSPDENSKQSQAIKDLLEAIYPKADKEEYVINIEPIETNPNAVFQHVNNASIPDKNSERSKTPELAEVQVQEPATEQVPSPPQAEVVKPLPSEPIKQDTSATPSDKELPNVLKSFLETSKVPGTLHQFTCGLCAKEFNSRRGIRRHVRRLHKMKYEEMKKCVEMKAKKNLTSPKISKKLMYKTLTTTCQECKKTFATKANVRRHIEEVHKGHRRDAVPPAETPAKPQKPIHTETVLPKKTVKNVTAKKDSSKETSKETSKDSSKETSKDSSKESSTLFTCKCPHCRRKYSSQVLLKKHLQVVHKNILSAVDSQRQKRRYNTAKKSEVKVEVPEPVKPIVSLPLTVVHSPQNELKGANHINEKPSTQATQKCKVKVDSEIAKSPGSSATGCEQRLRKPKLSAGFDFKQLYCKVCKRQFTSKQNLQKHIDLHTDGNTIFVKFYRCPICTYDTRRKRDVIRHITVVHKKTSRSLAKITSNLEGRAVKKPIEFVLSKEGDMEINDSEENEIAAVQGTPPLSPIKKIESTDVGIEVKVTKNFTLLRCNKCGKAFAKKTDLDQHKRAHKYNASSSPDEIKSRSTRSKTFVWL
ncbi:hypothetical protein NDU88_002245 [Pleurodeles waltl]|uniref:C2H2-type domain-containing protein n=1 Tax=Pleurodeles waltl TaxID=8319 RepID=A0AAV7SDS6_PLEWA|nr:hypothetical protein NDU88_002245 [Pleurodeles waltl]